METIKQILLVTFARNQLVFSKNPILKHGILSLLLCGLLKLFR